MKRVIDFLGSSLGLVILFPILGLLSLLVKLYDRGPVFFVAERIGMNGIKFRMFKFRSMVVDAHKIGAAITVGRDARITPIGHFLRSTKLDELPQLVNVFLGNMSLVGPRPEAEKYVALYSTDQRAVLKLKPGITDPASFAFFNESDLLAAASDPEQFYRDRVMPEKIRLNLEYARRAGVATDLLLILATVAKVFGYRMDVFSYLRIQPPQIKVRP